jgi:hypothetical protein
MSADHELQADYQEWRRLAEAEGEAIRTGDWIDVCNCQNALNFLQTRIIQHTSAAQAEWSRPDGNRAAHEESVRAMVRPLVDLEFRNYSLLEARMSAAQAELGKFEQASQTLRRLQRSYAPAQPAAWTSFS